jgi:hypothetical protein
MGSSSSGFSLPANKAAAGTIIKTTSRAEHSKNLFVLFMNSSLKNYSHKPQIEEYIIF